MKIVVIGTSAGGYEAICTLIGKLPADFSVPIAIVQHRAKESVHLAPLLQDCTALRVVEVEDKQPIEPGTIYIAPPDYHLLVDEDSFALSTEGLVGYSRPSIDVLFESASDAYGDTVVGVVLTGANADGSKGLRRIYDRGGRALVQQPDTAEVDVMPRAALKAVPLATPMTLERIAEHLVEIAEDRRAPLPTRVH